MKLYSMDEPPTRSSLAISNRHDLITLRIIYNAIGVFKDQAAVDGYPHWPGARPGDIIFQDVNERRVIDANDRIRLENNTIPQFQGGLLLICSTKDLTLTFCSKGQRGQGPISEHNRVTLETTLLILLMDAGQLKILALKNREPLTGKMNTGFLRQIPIGIRNTDYCD